MSCRTVSLALLASVAFGCAAAPPTRWNLILVSVDTLRADHLSSYGSETRTPAMDRLAEDGVLFEDVSSVAPTTLPAHASLLTGTTPLTHGVRDNVGFYFPGDAPTLATHLKEQGYETGAFVGAFVLDGRFGLARGFDVYDDALGAASEEMTGGLVAQRRGALVLRSALQWLERERGSPVFAFLHFYDPHTPYDPPPGFSPGTDDRSRYRGEVSYVDSLVGQLLDWLEEKGLEDRTVVVLTADHGESLGEHGELSHGYFVYQSTLAVPLLLRYPGAPAGRRVPGLARIIDVAPTVLELLGAPPLDRTDGESLVPFLAGELPERASYAETFVPRLHYGWSELRSLRRGDRKLILAPRPELYDLASDPSESNNRIAEEPELAEQMRRELEALAADEAPARSAPLDDESRRKLESLGYLPGSPGGSHAPRADPKDRLEVYLVLNDPLFESLEPDGPAFDDAVGRLEEVIEQDPSIPRAYVLLGDLLLKSGRAARAEAVFAKLVELEPREFTGHYGLGVARARLGRAEEALESLGRALELEPLDTRAHFQIAELEAERRNWGAAESWLRRALAVHSDETLKSRLAEVLLEVGKREEARSLLAGMASGDDARAAYNLGQLLLLDGDAEGAVRELRRAVSIDPRDADAHQALGTALAHLGQLEEALDSYRQAAALAPCFAQAHSNLGSAYAQMGRLREAAESLERAVSCDPGYAVAYKNLASVKLEMGEVSAAVTAMKKAVAASPGDQELQRLLRELEAYERSR